MNKFLEATFSFLSILGALLVSMTIAYGWIVFLTASILGAIWAKRTKNYYVMFMNLAFAVTNSIGIYNYLLSPYLAAL